ncbi:MAG TPA: hypothetical protein VMR02_21135 [Terracidiphilus sp.]|jgi:hypothetical protein|nr:hypothetical protein [Terracidiphilus sp.]
MSKDGKVEQVRTQEDEASKGPNLTLIYSLLGAALLIATGLAALIVLPFYHRH